MGCANNSVNLSRIIETDATGIKDPPSLEKTWGSEKDFKGQKRFPLPKIQIVPPEYKPENAEMISTLSLSLDFA